jgi:hypothetical protein
VVAHRRNQDLWDRLASFGISVAAVLIDIGFVAFWAIAQWAVNEYVITPLNLHGIDKWILLVFQVVFAISTLIIILIYMWEDLAIMFVRARARIAREKMRVETKQEPENDR